MPIAAAMLSTRVTAQYPHTSLPGPAPLPVCTPHHTTQVVLVIEVGYKFRFFGEDAEARPPPKHMLCALAVLLMLLL